MAKNKKEVANKALSSPQHSKSALMNAGILLVFIGFSVFLSDVFRIQYSVSSVMVGFIAIISALIYDKTNGAS